jgi:hypothetical protein
VSDEERTSFGQAIADDETTPRRGYADERAVFAGALAAARRAEPETLAGLSELVELHSHAAAHGHVGDCAVRTWMLAVREIPLGKPPTRLRAGMGRLARLARGPW